jgi:hypothetical protein
MHSVKPVLVTTSIKQQGQRTAWRIPSPKKFDTVTLTYDLENQVFQILLRTKYIPSLVKIH